MKKTKLVIILGLLPIFSLASSTWIGNGSVMSSYRSVVTDKGHDGPYPYGVTKDMTNTHSTYFAKNVAFFQWFINKTACERLKFYTDSNSQKVNISVGPWHSRSIDRTFKDVDLPFVIGKENVGGNSMFNDDNWLVTAVEFTDTTDSEGLYSECTRESITDINPTTSNGSNIIVDGYKWQGNGSIISGFFKSQYDDWNNPTKAYLNPSNQWPYGVFKDVSRFHSWTDKQVVFFQWLKSDECPNLQINILDNYDRDGNLINTVPKDKKEVKLVSKKWSASLSDASTKNVQLPYIMEGTELWTVLGVYSDKTFNHDYKVEAKCTKENTISNNDSSDVSSTVLSFLSTYFTLSDNKRALKITNHLSNINMLYNYANGLEEYTDPTEEVLYSLEFFLRNSPDVFGGEYVSEGTMVNAYRELQSTGNQVAEYSHNTLNFYIHLEEYGSLYNSYIRNATVKLYPVTQYQANDGDAFNESNYRYINESNRYSISSRYIGGIYGYSFGEVASGLYVVEIEVDGKKYIKSAFVPMKSKHTVDIVLKL